MVWPAVAAPLSKPGLLCKMFLLFESMVPHLTSPLYMAHAHRTTAATKAETLYGLIPKEHWSYPSWINPQEAAAARRKMVANGVLYGGRESYHHMCRYFSGFFFRHPLLARFDFYWRMEPDVHYYCDLDYDPFLYMQVSMHSTQKAAFTLCTDSKLCNAGLTL